MCFAEFALRDRVRKVLLENPVGAAQRNDGDLELDKSPPNGAAVADLEVLGDLRRCEEAAHRLACLPPAGAGQGGSAAGHSRGSAQGDLRRG